MLGCGEKEITYRAVVNAVKIF